MPSASIKFEKNLPCEAPENIKGCLNMIEKKMRNLEKRKLKLDNLQVDVKKGKELNEDQKIAVSKYDCVLSQIEYSKDVIKQLNSMYLEAGRQQKKQAKKELLERQQHEIQRLKLAFLYQYILSRFQNEDVRSDFLNGENGAVQLSSEQLSHLDQLNKLLGPGLPNDMADLENHFHTLAENHLFLVEGKNKEVAGTTYKVLKELLQSIKECGYFTRASEPLVEDVSSDDLPEDEVERIDGCEVPADIETPIQCDVQEQLELEIQQHPVAPAIEDELPAVPAMNLQNGPLQEVLVPQSTFNFLQESQIDLDAPHMDPAVVAVHQIAPPTVNFTMSQYQPPEAPIPSLTNGIEHHEPSPPTNPVMTAGMSHPVAPLQHDFDPSHPIPTQTFTNQSFTVMQNMMMPPAYVPVTMHHGPLPGHVPIAVVSGPPVSSAPPASVMPLHMSVPVAVSDNGVLPVLENVSRVEEAGVDLNDQCQRVNGTSDDDPALNDGPAEKHEGYHQYRGGYRGRGRGRGNNYFRGRSNYHNGHNGRGGYQNRFYQDRNGYNNYRRDNNRGPRGSGGGRGSRGNNRPQTQPPQQQQ